MYLIWNLKKILLTQLISNGVLHHTKDAEEAFKCLVKVLKSGGITVVGLYHKYGRKIIIIKK